MQRRVGLSWACGGALWLAGLGSSAPPHEPKIVGAPVCIDSISSMETAVVAEMNLLRRDPAGYAHFLEEMLRQFKGKVLNRPGMLPLQTQEGTTAVQEAIEALRQTPPMDTMARASGLSRAAGDHVRDQGPTGQRGHDGTDGSSFSDRVTRYGVWDGGLGENIYYGQGSAREVVLQLLVDDGIPSRSHRKTMLNPTFRIAGVACGTHSIYRQMCVIEYAVAFAETP